MKLTRYELRSSAKVAAVLAVVYWFAAELLAQAQRQARTEARSEVHVHELNEHRDPQEDPADG